MLPAEIAPESEDISGVFCPLHFYDYRSLTQLLLYQKLRKDHRRDFLTALFL
jgi:hypothetical protein